MGGKQLQFTFHNNYDPDLVIGSGTAYGIIDLDGFDGSDFDVTTEDYGFDGGYRKKQRVGVRQMGIHFAADTDAAEAKERVLGHFTPYKDGRLTVVSEGVTRAIDYYVKTTQNKRDNMFAPVEFELQLIGTGGYFEDDGWNLADLATWEGGLKLPHAGRFKLRHRASQYKTIHNDGHAATPLWITFKGPAQYPKVKNITTGKEIQLATTMGANQTLSIITSMNNPRIYIEDTSGNKINGYPYLTNASDLEFFLEVGDNVFQYATANSEQVNEVTLRYKRYYVGI